MADWYLVSVVVFSLIFVALAWKDRKNLKRESFMLLRKTQRGKRLIIRAGTTFPGFWKAIGVFAVVIGFAVSVFFMFYLGQNAYLMLTAEEAPPPTVGVLLPIPIGEPVMLPGVIGIPFWHWIIGIALLVLFHEGMHGVMAAREGLKIKSMGWGLLAIIPLAFVEPDEKELKRRPVWQQLRVFAAGSFGNFVLGGISIITWYLFMMSLHVPGGVAFSGYVPGYPAEQANLTGVVVGISTGARDYAITGVGDLTGVMKNITPGENVTVRTHVYYRNYTFDERAYTLTAAADNETGAAFLGITFNPAIANFYRLADIWWQWRYYISYVGDLLQWLFLINLGVGAVNLLPIGPLDGGRMWHLVFKKYAKRRSRHLTRIVTYITLAVLGANFVIPLLRSLAGL